MTTPSCLIARPHCETPYLVDGVKRQNTCLVAGGMQRCAPLVQRERPPARQVRSRLGCTVNRQLHPPTVFVVSLIAHPVNFLIIKPNKGHIVLKVSCVAAWRARGFRR